MFDLVPEQADFYADCVRHPKVVRVLALSGGYTQEDADTRLRKNHGVVASFSRALPEGLSAHQTDAEFNATLRAAWKAVSNAARRSRNRFITGSPQLSF
jgi:fructose-bisphosphate aldolase class I